MSFKVIKVIGIATTLAGAGLSVLSSWVDDKKLDEKVHKEVTKAFKEFNGKES